MSSINRRNLAKSLCLGVAVAAFAGASSGAAADQLASADRIVVRKSERKLYLYRGDRLLASYRIALGLNPHGPKEQEHDFRTPEGHYTLARRNTHSDYFLSIQVSYPNKEDELRARKNHVEPGGAIMIHGLPNTMRHPPAYYASADWTDGCIALSNSDMVEVWMRTQDDIPIDIYP